MSTTITSKIHGAIITEAGNGYPSEGAIIEADGDAWRIVSLSSHVLTLPRGNSVIAAVEPAQWGDEDPRSLRVQVLPALRLELDTRRTAEAVSDEAEWALDVAAVAAGLQSRADLLTYCLRGVDEDEDPTTAEEWRDYVTSVCVAAGLEEEVSS